MVISDKHYLKKYGQWKEDEDKRVGIQLSFKEDSSAAYYLLNVDVPLI